MALMALHGMAAEEYANFLNSRDDNDIRQILGGQNASDSDAEYDYIPMEDADCKTLKLKIQLRDVSKPPMWREVLVPAEFNFSQLHYIIQAAVGLDNCHLWQFERKPYDNSGVAIGIPKESFDSFGIEDCTCHADETPLTAFLAQKGDKLVYVYDFRLDWIFNVSVVDVLDRQGGVAECRKYKSDLQAMDDCPAFLYSALREYQQNPRQVNKDDMNELLRHLYMEDEDTLYAYLDDHLFDIEFVNEQLAEIPDEWEMIF